MDYSGISGVLLSFNTGDMEQCHTVQINNDAFCEQPARHFVSQLTYVRGIMPITVDPDMTTVIIDDDKESECGEYTMYNYTP